MTETYDGTVLLDGAVGTLTANFTITTGSGMIWGANLSTEIALQIKTGDSWTPVLKGGAAVTLGVAGDMPLGIPFNGRFRLVASSLAPTEKVYFLQAASL